MLEHLDDLVVKAVGESGGYGMLIGPHSTAAERDEFRARICADPRNYIAQPTLALSRAPCFMTGGSSRATWTCGRTCCSARRSRSSPAA